MPLVCWDNLSGSEGVSVSGPASSIWQLLFPADYRRRRAAGTRQIPDAAHRTLRLCVNIFSAVAALVYTLRNVTVSSLDGRITMSAKREQYTVYLYVFIVD